jgi:hypothetical protein
MKINGYKLRESLKRWQTRRDTVSSQFNGSLKKFEGDDKLTPGDVMDRFLQAEAEISKLQTEQMRYNLEVKVSVPTLAGGQKTITLAEAIKCVGGLGRAEKMWRSASTEVTDRFGYRDEDTREADKVYARRTISLEEAGKLSTDVGRVAGAFREAIASGNAFEIESDLPQSSFD